METTMQARRSSAAAAMLPPEVLSQIFLEVDPHTLYTSVRALSRSWKQCVEERLLAREFESGRWRVGLRVVRKPKVGSPWQGGIVGGKGFDAPGALWNEVRSRAEEDESSVGNASDEEVEARRRQAVERAEQAYRTAVLTRHGALEDELAPLDARACDELSAAQPIVHVIPLKYKRYDGASTTLQFATPENELQALFENGNSSADPSRLDLDFGIVWRFPGDGQDNEQWGEADPENGWLSRFYCSTFDMDVSEQDEDKVGSCRLISSPLARRVRRTIRHPTGSGDVEDDEEDEEEDVNMQRHSSTSSKPMEWSDGGHEYASLSLSLGTEFFVRRSARANQLTRRLEVAAAAAQSMRNDKRRRLLQSAASTPRRSPKQTGTPLTTDDLSSIRRHLAATATSSTALPSGMSTPAAPAWKNGGLSYAYVASSPPSEATSRRSSSSSPGHRGPRVVRAVPMSSNNSSNGKVAPMPSVNVSGYASVHHQAPIDGKEEEEVSHDLFSASMTRSSSSSSDKGYISNMAISSHHSVPRAHFSAKLVRMPLSQRSPNDWKDYHGRTQYRDAALTQGSGMSIAIWEWCR